MEELKKLYDVTKNHHDGAHEVTKVDKFIDPYMGKFYQNFMGEQRATELISVGLEHLYTNPEYFEWIINVIRGAEVLAGSDRR